MSGVGSPQYVVTVLGPAEGHPVSQPETTVCSEPGMDNVGGVLYSASVAATL